MYCLSMEWNRENEKCCGNTTGECFHSFFEFCQTSTSVSINLFLFESMVSLYIMQKALIFLFLFFFFFSELVLSSWIYKSSSLPFLSRFDADATLLRPALLSRNVSDCNGQHEFISQGVEPNTAACDVQGRNRLTSSEKKSLIRKRLIPLIISLLILGAAVAIHLLVPLPSSHDTASVGNDTLSFNVTIVTTESPTSDYHKLA